VSGELVVVDTNVVVAGLLTSESAAPTARILDAMLAGRVRYLLSEELLWEYRTVLLRPKIAAAHGLAADEVDEILVRLAANGAVRASAVMDSGTGGDRHLFRLLEAEPEARLVTGDARVLERAGRRGWTPRDALTGLRLA
jgi:putative PIN family toxin of toxin-antitoxin system